MPDTAKHPQLGRGGIRDQPRIMPTIPGAKPARPMNRANDTDKHVGNRIRERRIMLGLSQQQMADLIGVTYQQAHK